ncbi:hypothetical protein EVAR_61079_1 [Eumeta japonica]|uniref:Uncharacterized protein n=1 Tax=Eumeta variegata TaxID=151549 RepID=A0A4C1YRN0_EUMVA|nr:hypothetical protein EVAR_61079_1 [Eumeta japonica]
MYVCFVFARVTKRGRRGRGHAADAPSVQDERRGVATPPRVRATPAPASRILSLFFIPVTSTAKETLHDAPRPPLAPRRRGDGDTRPWPAVTGLRNSDVEGLLLFWPVLIENNLPPFMEWPRRSSARSRPRAVTKGLCKCTSTYCSKTCHSYSSNTNRCKRLPRPAARLTPATCSCVKSSVEVDEQRLQIARRGRRVPAGARAARPPAHVSVAGHRYRSESQCKLQCVSNLNKRRPSCGRGRSADTLFSSFDRWRGPAYTAE